MSVCTATTWDTRKSVLSWLHQPPVKSLNFAFILNDFSDCVNSPELKTNIRQHDDVIKWKQFPRYWPFVRGIHRSPLNSPHKGQWRGALMFSVICAWINAWVNNREDGDLKRHRTHYNVTGIVCWKHSICILLLHGPIWHYMRHARQLRK